jgi:hypothetical protein
LRATTDAVQYALHKTRFHRRTHQDDDRENTEHGSKRYEQTLERRHNQAEDVVPIPLDADRATLPIAQANFYQFQHPPFEPVRNIPGNISAPRMDP